ncbi:MAG: hypothetical protein J5958_06955 [Clostridia bacterium]|nr:hypothetical protein [Clostridia bacterium]MBR5044702.1 hypothetical protein [Clostridia bacterium]
MKKIITSFTNEDEKRDLVRSEDAAFLSRMSACTSRLAAEKDLRVLTVSGASCSGKTTTANLIDAALESVGRRVHTISLDDFFFSREELVRRAEETGGKLDFDSPDTLDLASLAEVTEAAFSGNRILVPEFDFQRGRRVGVRDFGVPRSEDVYLFEGIQAIYPEVTALLSRHHYRSVFLWVGEDATYGDVVFSIDDLRFLRRLVRDARFRSAEPEFTFQIWETVRANEEKHIFPFSDSSDYLISTYHAYEPNMLRDEAIALLSTIGQGSPWYPAATDLIERLTPIPPISPAYLTEQSLFHEFFG